MMPATTFASNRGKETPICPVCGMDASSCSDEHLHTKHHGCIYYFCSVICQDVFIRDPNAYLDMQMQRFHERSHELELIRKETLACLSRAAEFKDNETGAHTERIGAYSYRLAIISGLDHAHAVRILETAPLHDVGKIGIPDHILLKPGKLTASERKIIEQHSEMGAEILGKNLHSRIMRLASLIAISHHEKWDGSGYPYGLKEDAIPIEGRIVSISDVFDALVSERPYKPAWSMKKVRAHIDSERGRHFDPEMARLFVQYFCDFEDIYNRFKDSAPSDDE